LREKISYDHFLTPAASLSQKHPGLGKVFLAANWL